MYDCVIYYLLLLDHPIMLIQLHFTGTSYISISWFTSPMVVKTS